MSLESWKQEFYPIEANEVSKENAISHSIRKWEGLRKENLKKHGVYVKGSLSWLIDNIADKTFILRSSTCALCYLYYEGFSNTNQCLECPLYRIRNNVQCDEKMKNEKYSPYSNLHDRGRNGSPEPMIMWLKLAKYYEENKLIGKIR